MIDFDGTKFDGIEISEEECAIGLGFKNVPEFRRWKTEQGQKGAELEVRLREAERDRDGFLWHLKRMGAVLERIRPTLADRLHVLAVDVALGMAVDWGHELDDWWTATRP